jgi:protein TonB
MEKSAILQADLLDILFEGRNKEYGAYELRRTYNRRLRISVTVMLSLIGLLFIGQLLAGRLSGKEAPVMPVNDSLALVEVLPDETPIPPPPEVKPPPQQQVKTIAVTTPVIKPDQEVPETEMPPLEKIETAKIDVVTKDGLLDDGIVPPPADEGRDIIEAPKKRMSGDSLFIDVQIQSEYPGGMAAWRRFLMKTLGNYPQDALDNRIQGTVTVQFIVDKEGKVSDVQAVSGPEELRPYACKAIMKSGKWTPAIQNGMHVKSYKRQPITFVLPEE